MPKLRILLADDHETVREGLKVILNSQPDMEVVAEASEGRAAVAQADAAHPDVVVMDVSMPLLNGMKATQVIKQQHPDMHVIALTRHADDGYLQQVMRAGASAYVLKQSPSSELLHAIRSVAAGGTYMDSAVAGRLIGYYKRRRQAAVESPDSSVLSPREEEVLRMVAWGHSNKEIAARLEVSIKTVETHKANATHKLGLRTRIDIVRYALLQGWLHDA